MPASDWPVEVVPLFGCWRWTGRVDDDGYGIVWQGRQPAKAYRQIYETEVGPVPPDKVLDHTCRERYCVAPHHLEPVSKAENELRKSWTYRVRRRKCGRGHSLTDAIMTRCGGRVCRSCNSAAGL